MRTALGGGARGGTGSQRRARLAAFIENPLTQRVILALILINAVTLGLETSPAIMAVHGELILALDKAILGVFVLEIALRLYVHRLRFFRDPWSVFDFLVVGIALLPATGLLGAIPGLMSIGLVLLLIYYVFGVIATNLFAAAFPEWFGHLGRSLYTLFQIMTLESWSMGISRPVMEQFPYAWIFFIAFILVATFTMLNLFIAIIVNAMQSFGENEQRETVQALEQAREHIEADLHAEVRALRQEIGELKALLRDSRS